MGLMLALALAVAPAEMRADEAQDTAVATQIAQRLKQSGRLQGYRIGVKYKDGAAWLVGTVTNEQQLAAAIAIAEQTPGVDYIINKLEVATPTAVASDAGAVQAGAVQPVSAQQPTPARGSEPIAQTPSVMHAAQPAPAMGQRGVPLPIALVGAVQPGAPMPAPVAAAYTPGAMGAAQVNYESPNMPSYAWPSYAAAPNYAAVTYPKQYSPTAFPYIGPFYPYPQVPLGWRRVSLEWDDGWWMLDFHERHGH
jgi:hypothetical protein